MDILRVRLVSKRTEDEFAVRTLDSRLIVLRVIRNTAVCEQIALVILIHEVLRAVHEESLRAKTRVEREQNLLSHVNGVGRGDGIRQFEVIAILLSESTGSNFLLCDGVEAIEKILGGSTACVAHTAPDSIIELFGERLGDKSKHLASRRHRLLSVALSGTRAEERRDSRVRLELSDHRTEERFKRSEVQLQVHVLRASWRVRSELCRSVERAHTLLVADARATGHKLKSLVAADNRQTKEVRTPLSSSILVFL